MNKQLTEKQKSDASIFLVAVSVAAVSYSYSREKKSAASGEAGIQVCPREYLRGPVWVENISIYVSKLGDSPLQNIFGFFGGDTARSMFTHFAVTFSAGFERFVMERGTGGLSLRYRSFTSAEESALGVRAYTYITARIPGSNLVYLLASDPWKNSSYNALYNNCKHFAFELAKLAGDVDAHRLGFFGWCSQIERFARLTY